MKKLIYLLGITLTLLQSCSSGDSSDSIPSNSQLVGKWEAFQIGVFPKGTVITGNETLKDVSEINPCKQFKDYFVFGNEGAYRGIYYNADCFANTFIGTYTKTDFIVSLYVNNKLDFSFEIISLDNNVLKIKAIDTSDSPEFTVVSYKKV